MAVSDDKTIVYGKGLGNLVFMPRERALELAQTYEAVHSSTTWGEFKNRLPARIHDELMDFLKLIEDEDDKPLPQDEEAFEPDDVPSFADGDWPGFPAQEMLEWMPEEVQRQFGRQESTTLNGFYLELDQARDREIVAALEQYGFICVEDQHLIEQAHGGLFDPNKPKV